MKISIYQNNKKVYTGYTKSVNEVELIKEFGEHPLAGTHQGDVLHNGDVVEVEIGNDNMQAGTYIYVNGLLTFAPVDLSKAEPMNGVRVLMVQPNFPACETRLISRLKPLQDAVSDHREPSLIEYSFPYPDDCMILGNEEAKLINMPLNRELNSEIYAGPIFVVKDDHYGNLIDLSDEEVKTYMDRIGEPQQFDDSVIQKSPYLRFFGY